MGILFSQSFKIQAVEKALNRKNGIKLKDIAESLGVGYSALQKWIRQSKSKQRDPALYGKVGTHKDQREKAAILNNV